MEIQMPGFQGNEHMEIQGSEVVSMDIRGSEYTFFIRTSKFPPRLGAVFLIFPPSRGWIVLNMFLYSYCFLVKFSFSLL